MLTPIQAELLETLRRRVDGREPTPTYRELCAEFGWASTGTVRDHLRALARKGYVKLAGGHRQLRLNEEHVLMARVPLVGRVVAGVPVTSEETAEEVVPVPAAWTLHGSHFAVRVAGDSMRDAGILDGDQVVVRQQSTAKDGDIVVATVDGETTLKRLRIRGRRATLIAENPSFKPIEIRTASAIIQGIVVGLLRAYNRPLGVKRRESARGLTKRAGHS